MKRTKQGATKRARVEAEIIDDLDEEFELELGEDRVDAIMERLTDQSGDGSDFRAIYFRDLLRLQKELVKLQAGEACLLISRRTFSQGRVASLADLYHPGSRYELAANCQPR